MSNYIYMNKMGNLKWTKSQKGTISQAGTIKIEYMNRQIPSNGIETVFYKFQQTKVQNQMVSLLEPDGFTQKS